jgi:hypothetical protein
MVKGRAPAITFYDHFKSLYLTSKLSGKGEKMQAKDLVEMHSESDPETLAARTKGVHQGRKNSKQMMFSICTLCRWRQERRMLSFLSS